MHGKCSSKLFRRELLCIYLKSATLVAPKNIHEAITFTFLSFLFVFVCFVLLFFFCGRVEGGSLPIIHKYALNTFLVLERKTKRECYLEAL